MGPSNELEIGNYIWNFYSIFYDIIIMVILFIIIILLVIFLITSCQYESFSGLSQLCASDQAFTKLYKKMELSCQDYDKGVNDYSFYYPKYFYPYYY